LKLAGCRQANSQLTCATACTPFAVCPHRSSFCRDGGLLLPPAGWCHRYLADLRFGFASLTSIRDNTSRSSKGARSRFGVIISTSQTEGDISAVSPLTGACCPILGSFTSRYNQHRILIAIREIGCWLRGNGLDGSATPSNVIGSASISSRLFRRLHTSAIRPALQSAASPSAFISASISTWPSMTPAPYAIFSSRVASALTGSV